VGLKQITKPLLSFHNRIYLCKSIIFRHHTLILLNTTSLMMKLTLFILTPTILELRTVRPTIITVVLVYLFMKPFHILLLTLVNVVMNRILKFVQ